MESTTPVAAPAKATSGNDMDQFRRVVETARGTQTAESRLRAQPPEKYAQISEPLEELVDRAENGTRNWRYSRCSRLRKGTVHARDGAEFLVDHGLTPDRALHAYR